MLFVGLAVDYDGTLAMHGHVADETVEALRRVKDHDKSLILVTGRQLSELELLFEPMALFDAIVAENGAVLHWPALRQTTDLSSSPPSELIKLLRNYEVSPLWIGRGIVSTWEPNQEKVLEAIRALGLEWKIVFNKGAVMCLSPGVTKASGLNAALSELKLSSINIVGVGDAENDHAFLDICGCSAAVANAIEALKAKVDLVLQRDHGEGVIDLVDIWLGGAPNVAFELPRHRVELGTGGDGEAILLKPDLGGILIVGASGGGKSTLAKALMERIAAHGYQYLALDPEGDYRDFSGPAHLGLPDRAPTREETLELLDAPDVSLVLNLLGLDVSNRGPFFAALLGRLSALRAEKGRPHWLIIDEAHQFFPAKADASSLVIPAETPGMVLVTVDPGALMRAALERIQCVIATGPDASEGLGSYCAALGLPTPLLPTTKLNEDEVVYWLRGTDASPVVVRAGRPKQAHKRHTRKYAEGRLDDERSFYFRGPEGKLSLRASNLMTFLDLAEGVDADTWLHHLRRGDYSRWFRDNIGDAELADETQRVESDPNPDAEASRRAVRRAIKQRYTAPASV